MSFISGPLDLGQVHPPELSPSRHVPELVADFIHPRATNVDPLRVQSLIGTKSLRTLFRALFNSPSTTFASSFGWGPSSSDITCERSEACSCSHTSMTSLYGDLAHA
jgi:hypothetical protein